MSAKPERPRLLGPRGIQGLFGWTFFDPANLVSSTLLVVSATLVVLAMRGRDAPDWGMALGLYTCIALFLRGYFFNYYHGRALGRITVLLVLLLALLASAALWEDRAPAHQALRMSGVQQVERAEGFHIAALLHLVMAVTLFIHVCLPRRWVIRATDELADRSGRDTAHDAPLETIDDPEERARREAERARGAEKKAAQKAARRARKAARQRRPGDPGGEGPTA
ncbi:MAG: hypothetical protein R3F60_05840 [bacterium]